MIGACRVPVGERAARVPSAGADLFISTVNGGARIDARRDALV
jgi:hypothetical protein